MYEFRAVVLSVFVASVIALDEEHISKCKKIVKPELLKCCITTTSDPDITPTPEIKECFDKPDSESSCELDECVAKKLGYYGSDGSLNMEALTNVLKKKFNDNKDLSLLTLLNEKCLTGDLSKYGTDDTCEFTKMKRCVHIQYLKFCPEWNNEGDCNGMGKLVKECTTDF